MTGPRLGRYCDIYFKPEFAGIFENRNAAKVALLVTREFEGKEQEGLSRNGGIGTYYRTLSRKLAEDGWYIILLISVCEHRFRGESKIPEIKHIFSASEAEEVLDLQSSHRSILGDARIDSQLLDYESFLHMMFTQAIVHTFDEAHIYVEHHELFGTAFRTIQAKEAGLLGRNCLVAITMHGCLEWVYESHDKFVLQYLDYYWQASHLEQTAFESADLAFFPSHALKKRVESYGWSTAHARHQPYFVPIVEPAISEIESERQTPPRTQKRSLVFFGRLEERKGLCTFVEALKQLTDYWKERIEVYFVGRVVALETFRPQNIDSRQYIAQELADEIHYTVYSGFSSAEAIAFTRGLSSPVVCLTSNQENFPNTALEMGQLPISLIVSDTGGFRETLQLLERTEGVYWFAPRDVTGLMDAILQVLCQPPQPHNVPTHEKLEQINRRLLTQKLTYIQQAFPRQPLSSPSVGCPQVTVVVCCAQADKQLLNCLHSLSVQSHMDLEVVVLCNFSRCEADSSIFQQAGAIFPRIGLLRTSHALEVDVTWKRLKEMINGKFVVVFEASSVAMPFAIEQLLQTLQTAQAEMATCSVLDSRNPDRAVNLTQIPLPALLKTSGQAPACVLLPVGALDDYAPNLTRPDGLHTGRMLASALAHGRKIAYYPYPLCQRQSRTEPALTAKEHLREQYALRHYLARGDAGQWSRRQLYVLLSAAQQLLYQEIAPPAAYSHAEPAPEPPATPSVDPPAPAAAEGSAAAAAAADYWQSQWRQAQLRIAAMESSKFWKFRKVWFSLKQRLGLPNDE
ncbi:glycosyltransferase [Gloeobacter violaceus]|uniref:Glr4304 protein n=1 Tax=Gloeobacter violaceus (strain ATCC 29082 / PCC 7421) TaxID=251221 RepID=Q7NDD1_GLOVI|nr:glycosyltransferase [Gloeobacter violaceus]BAC92245.1 glr4304 [Gloeobacter violaceus PCC 7421]